MMDGMYIPAGIRVLRRKCVVCGQKKPNTRLCWHLEKDVQQPDGSQLLYPICRRCEQHKLTATEVVGIRALYADGVLNQHELAARYGVDQQVIWSIIHRKRWAHIA